MYVKRQYLFLVIFLMGLLLYCSSKYKKNKRQLVLDSLVWRKSNELIKTSTEKDVVEDEHINSQRSVLNQVRIITNCLDRPLVPWTQERGDYWVLYNYVRAERSHRCHESITYTTHGDYSFLDNLVPLLRRWLGPISVALHAPGKDFNNTLAAVAFLRGCTDPLVRELVTFHIYFPKGHVPNQVPRNYNWLKELSNCSLYPPYMNVSRQEMYKNQMELLYPINIGRNIARETAQTHFIFPSDMELYPSLNIIPKFLTMIAENKGPLLSKNPKVFVLHPFEVTSNSNVPENKTVLRKMLLNHTAVSFHQNICPQCHNVPKSKAWQKQIEVADAPLHVFHVAKRLDAFSHWEPFYIGTHSDPYYDERLSWEGQNDKTVQGYALCALDYEFLILDNAFLIHRPGIKVYKYDGKRDKFIQKTNYGLLPIIHADIKIMFGNRKDCAI